MSFACLGRSTRAAVLSIASSALIGLATPALSFGGADELSLGDPPAVINLSPRTADGLRLDVPSGYGSGAECEEAERSSPAKRRCSDTRAIDALSPTGTRPASAAPAHGVR
jgi:hypothetical protein